MRAYAWNSEKTSKIYSTHAIGTCPNMFPFPNLGTSKLQRTHQRCYSRICGKEFRLARGLQNWKGTLGSLSKMNELLKQNKNITCSDNSSRFLNNFLTEVPHLFQMFSVLFVFVADEEAQNRQFSHKNGAIPLHALHHLLKKLTLDKILGRPFLVTGFVVVREGCRRNRLVQKGAKRFPTVLDVPD